MLDNLRTLIVADRGWHDENHRQKVFMNELVDQSVEGPQVMTLQDQLAFIKTMCNTGESARYGQLNRDAVAAKFAAQIAQHAQRQFEESRKTLSSTMQSLRQYAEQSSRARVNETIGGLVRSVSAELPREVGVECDFREIGR